ncbi:hypothetical protein [Sphingomonas sp.]|uniref:hypothetical protein n=1 Tax=Sphingomonas sp. TaxID=28214 RepID=UPI001EBACFFA|nr:hypothetical protein [Sphingomonas sp.]MBX3594447.1 hypothetical protein [Sphingomonas sp.]
MAAHCISEPRTRRHAGIALATATGCLAASLALFWPGYAMFDSVAQFGEVLSGRYDDWHPPVMARLWALLHGMFGGGAGPMLAVHLALYWTGFGLIAGALARDARRRAAVAVIAIGLCPLFLGWQATVLKDAGMAGALIAASGLLCWWRIDGRPMPRAAWAVVWLLLVYAALVRANAVFAVVPFAVLASAPALSPMRKAVLIGVGIVLTIALSGPVNHILLRAAPTGVQQSEALYDLSGIAVRVTRAETIGLTPGERQALIEKRCVKPFFWDPIGAPDRCQAVVARLRSQTVGSLYATLAQAVLHHPVAYAQHRIAHLNSTMRLWVPFRWPNGAPPEESEPNSLGLVTPGVAAGGWQRIGGWVAETPLGWPFAWCIVALTMLVALRPAPTGPTRGLVIALAGSAVGQWLSFAVLSIASDLRYHLWAMIATALAVVIGAKAGALDRRAVRVGAAVLLAGCAVALAARLTQPLPPDSYQGMLG